MTISEDLLEGAQAIADELGWTTRKVYRAREEKWGIPIRRSQGLGIYALKSELKSWLSAPETL